MNKYVKIAQFIFFIHCVFSAASHLLIPIMAVGILKLLWSSSFGFWVSGLILGAAFFSITYLVNHITHEESNCYLTSLENYYREKAGLPLVKDFLPRFYYKLGRMWRYLWKK